MSDMVVALVSTHKAKGVNETMQRHVYSRPASKILLCSQGRLWSSTPSWVHYRCVPPHRVFNWYFTKQKLFRILLFNLLPTCGWKDSSAVKRVCYIVEDLGSVPSTLTLAHSCNSISGDPLSSLASLDSRHACGGHINSHAHKIKISAHNLFFMPLT